MQANNNNNGQLEQQQKANGQQEEGQQQQAFENDFEVYHILDKNTNIQNFKQKNQGDLSRTL
jgi:hypothetical protein